MAEDFQSVLTDPDFRQSHPDTKREILSSIDPDFAGASRATQDEILRGMSAEIKAPPTVGDYVIGGAKMLAREALPVAGMIGGGMLGAVAGGLTTGPLAGLGAPAGAAAGGILGYTTGQQANRTLAALMPSQAGQYVAQPPLGLEPAPPDIWSQLKAVGRDVMTGAIMETLPIVGAGLARGMRGLLGIGAATGSDIAAREAASRSGIQLPASAASASSAVSQMEAFPAGFPVGRQTVEPIATRIRTESQAATERLGTSLGPPVPLEQAGSTIRREVTAIARAQEQAPTELVDRTIAAIGGHARTRSELGQQVIGAGKGVEDTRRAAARVAYDRALTSEAKAMEIPLARTNEMASTISAFERRLQGVQSPAMKRAEGLQQATGGNTEIQASSLPPEARAELFRIPDLQQAAVEGGPIPLNSLTAEFIERYGLQATGSRTLEEAVAIQQRLRGLARNATDDVTRRQIKNLLDAVSDDIGAAFPGTALSDAARFYKEEVALYFARKAPLRQLLGKEPSKVADQILGAASTERLQEIMKIFPARDVADVQRAVLDRLKQKAVSVSTGEVSPGALESALQTFGEDNLHIVFGGKMPMVEQLRATLKTNFGRDTTSSAQAALLEAAPERILNLVARGKIKSEASFDALWNVLSPQARQESRTALYGEVLANSFDPATRQFSTVKFLREKEQIPQHIWDRIFTQNEAAALGDLAVVFHRLNRYARVTADPAQLSATILGRSQILAGVGGAAYLGGRAAVGEEDTFSFAKKSAGLIALLLVPTIFGKAVLGKMGQSVLTSPVAKPYEMSTGGLFYRTGAAMGASQTNPP